MRAVVAQHGRWGFWKCHDRLRLEGHGWNHKRTWRVYCAIKLNLPRRVKRGLPTGGRQSLQVTGPPNESWVMDFISDTLYRGGRFRTLNNVLDDGVRDGLAIEVDTSLPATRVARTLKQIVQWRGLPKALRLDNGPELIAGPGRLVR